MSRPADIVTLVEAAAKRFPQATAILSAEGLLTYEELWLQSADLAEEIQRTLTLARPLVAVNLARTPWFVVTTLAVLRAGGVVFPTDPSDISQRQKAVKERALPVLEITKPPGACIPKVAVLEPSVRADLPAVPAEAAYLLHTSGSTGMPKGVILTHSNLAYFFAWATQTYQLGPGSAVAGVSPFSFDHSILELFLPLTSGATLVLVDQSHRFVDWLERRPIDLLCTVPSAFRSPLALKGLLERKDLVGRLTNIHLGGEALSADLVSDIFENIKCKAVTNCYGPTETTIYATTLRMEQPPSESPSVGFPLPYTRIRILDPLGKECCAGDEGEVFIVGSGVSAGYLKAEEIHSERFVELPTPTGRAERAYRTGDIGALSPEGELRLLGRKDRQIKIHGHRIELDEVEMAINVLSGIRECAVVVAKERLVAHVVLDGVTVDQARKSVVEQLPPWMRPVSYVTHASLPRTTSGKVDRTCLSHAA